MRSKFWYIMGKEEISSYDGRRGTINGVQTDILLPHACMIPFSI
jgi:hypothetical protein